MALAGGVCILWDIRTLQYLSFFKYYLTLQVYGAEDL